MDTLLLTRSDVVRLLPMPRCIDAVETAFRLLGEGKAQPPGTLAVHAEDGAFHVKAGLLAWGDRAYFVCKANGNFPVNAERGQPTIQGLVTLCDGSDGRVLAVIDSMELTALRTAAATAAAARVMAPADATVAAVIGCGVQSRHQLRALAAVLPLRRVAAYDLHAERARAFCREMADELGIEGVARPDPGSAAREADVVVTCTTAREFILGPGDVRPGTFVAGVGVDNAAKRELHPALLARARVVTDLRDQCARIGDLHHALDAGALTLADVHADLGEVVAGLRPGRMDDDEITVFDSTGIALQDVAAAAAVYEGAAADGGSARSLAFG
ncbi:MAG TPA: ornithine cyclodeaminase family protein [Longimicrobium sp.]|nr:ornithine cyclodeaminase family protein [Longimicrobium sp.]